MRDTLVAVLAISGIWALVGLAIVRTWITSKLVKRDERVERALIQVATDLRADVTDRAKFRQALTKDQLVAEILKHQAEAIHPPHKRHG